MQCACSTRKARIGPSVQARGGSGLGANRMIISLLFLDQLPVEFLFSVGGLGCAGVGFCLVLDLGTILLVLVVPWLPCITGLCPPLDADGLVLEVL